MSNIITKERKDMMKQILEENNIDGNKTTPFLWSLCCVDYIFYNGNIRVKDIKKYWTDGSGDGGIDYIYCKDNSNEIYLIQGKSETNISFKSIKTAVREITDTIKAFDSGKVDVNKNHYKRINGPYKSLINDKRRKNITIVIMTETELKDEVRNQVEIWKKDNKEFDEFKLLIYDFNNILEKVINVSTGEKTVEKGSLECVDSKFLEYSYGKNTGIIISIKAKSLRDLYEKEKNDTGLFGYNLRKKIRDNRIGVDEKIEKTIKEEKNSFWFRNNGITIACEKYKIDNNILSLTKFSIINGAQTATIIGEIDKEYIEEDFSIVCKIVKSPGSLNNDFVKDIAIASNSQKEIDSRDLRANSYEQILLQYKFGKNEYPLAVSIKRGVIPFNYKKVKQSWQKIDNKKLGQIILSAWLQKPGTARNEPNLIFTDLYNDIFNRKLVANYNYNALYDIVRLNDKYDKFRIEFTKQKDKEKRQEKDGDKIRKLNDEIGVLRNSGFTVISIITYLIKRKYFDLKRINGSKNENWKRFTKINIDTNLSLNYKNNDYDEKIKELFNEIVEKLFLLYSEEALRPDSRASNPSNYFKRDDIYRENIICAFDNLLENEPDHKIFKLLEIFDNNN